MKISNHHYITTPRTSQTIDSLWRLEKIILDSLNYKEVIQEICNSLLVELGYSRLGYKIVVLALIDQKEQRLKRISISQTPEAKKALTASPVPFSEIDIPLSAKDNLCIKVINEKKPASTAFWPDILYPAFTKKQAIIVQKIVGIKNSLVYPVMTKNEVIGVMIFSLVKPLKHIKKAEKDLLRSYTDVVGLAVQNSRLYSSLEQTTEKLKEANEKLKELDKLKDEFLSIAAHELRTPMTAIKGYLWLVLTREKMADKIRERIQRSYDSTERLITLVNDMLDVSRIEGGRIVLAPNRFNLTLLASQVKDELLLKANEKNLAFTVQDQKEHFVFADQEKTHQVLINLIGNALKFTPNNGKITVSFWENNNMVETSIADTGIGIKKEDLAKLFTKFGRLDNSLTATAGAGTGLGLYITKKIIELSGGEIRVESEFGKGSVFTFSLPTS